MPPAVVTWTSTAPVPGGETAVTKFELFTVKLVAGVPPNVTAVALSKWEPEIKTVVPPAVEPVPGLTDMTLGWAT